MCCTRFSVVLWLALAPSAFAVEVDAFAAPVESITLQQAVDRALQNHPRLAAYTQEVLAQEALTLQAAARPNPTLSVEVEDLALQDGDATETSRTAGLGRDGIALGRERSVERERGGAARALETTIRVSQPIELGGKRARRLRLAHLDRELAQWDCETVRAEIIAETTRRFYGLCAAEMDLRLAEARHRIAADLRDIVQTQVDAGDAAPLALKRAGAEFAVSEIALASAGASHQAQRAQLAALWGGNPEDVGATESTYGEPPALLPLERWLDRATENPDVARWRSELAQREATLALARAEAVPDLEAGLGLRATHNPDTTLAGSALDLDGIGTSRGALNPDRRTDWSLVFEVGVPLPLFNRNRGNIRAAEHRAGAAEASGRAALLDVRGALIEAHARANRARDTWSAVRESVIPALTETLDLTREGYTAGKFSLLEVLEVEQALAEAQAQANDALASYWIACTELQRLAGETNEDILEPAPAAPLVEEISHE